MKKFDDFLNEDLTDKEKELNRKRFFDQLEYYRKERNKKYKIYTSMDGIIEFTDDDLSPYGDESNVYFINDGFKNKYKSLNNKLEVKFDKNQMFVFIETLNGDFAEYKVFK